MEIRGTEVFSSGILIVFSSKKLVFPPSFRILWEFYFNSLDGTFNVYMQMTESFSDGFLYDLFNKFQYLTRQVKYFNFLENATGVDEKIAYLT